MKEGSMSSKQESRDVENGNRENVGKSVSTLLTVLICVPRKLIYLCIDIQSTASVV